MNVKLTMEDVCVIPAQVIVSHIVTTILDHITVVVIRMDVISWIHKMKGNAINSNFININECTEMTHNCQQKCTNIVGNLNIRVKGIYT